MNHILTSILSRTNTNLNHVTITLTLDSVLYCSTLYGYYYKSYWWALEYNLHLLYVQPIGNIAERFHALCVKDSGVLYEDPYIQVFSSFIFVMFSIFLF